MSPAASDAAGLLHVHPMLQQLPEAIRSSAAGMLEYITAPAGDQGYLDTRLTLHGVLGQGA